MIEAYAERYKLGVLPEELRKQAVEWSVTRGSRSGRVAWQFTQELAGRLGVRLAAKKEIVTAGFIPAIHVFKLSCLKT
jgi:predicted AAA+ superfamily ATPase